MDETKKNLNPAPPYSPETYGNKTAPSQESKDILFFNVMPKSGGLKGTLVEPVIKIQDTESHPENELKQKILKFKWYLVAAAVLIVVLVGYFVAMQIINNKYKAASLLLQPSQNNHIKDSGQNSTSSPLQANFTTPQEWREQHFGNNCTDESLCGDNADSDHDGLTNLEEYKLNTDPINPDSDLDGLADGDESHVFGSNPMDSKTSKDPKYTDSDFVKGGFDFISNKKMTPEQITAVSQKMQQFGLHQPTLTTLGNLLNSLYGFTPGSSSGTASSTPGVITGSSTPITGFDQSPVAKQDRDAQRSNTIKNIEAGLVKYKTDNKTFPKTSNFTVMYSQIKSYLKIATNLNDPINQGQFVYSYNANDDGTDFSLSFYSEGQNQIITKRAADAVKDSSAQEASVYDNQRQTDLESLRIALLLYSQKNIAGTQDYVFPQDSKYKILLVPDYIESIPKDPKTGQDYLYQVSATFNTFTLKTVLDNPATGTTGYMCNQDGCQNY